MNQRRTIEIRLFGIAGIVLAIVSAFLEYRPAETGVRWVPYADAFRIAEKEGKPVYVDVYASWCGPCTLMDKTTFANDTVVQLLQNDVVAVRVNIDDKETGTEVRKQFNIQAMPTSLLLTHDKRERKRNVGYMGPTELIEWIGDTVKFDFSRWQGFTEARAAAVREGKELLVTVMHDSLNIPGLQEQLNRSGYHVAMKKKYVPTLLIGIVPSHVPVIKQYALTPSFDFIAALYVFEPSTMEVVRVLPIRQSDLFKLKYAVLPLFTDDPS